MPPLKDEVGNRYGFLTVINRASKEEIQSQGLKDVKSVHWNCRCDCGNYVVVKGTSLRCGNTKSCGCLQKQRARESNIERGGIQPNQRYGRLVTQKFVPNIKNETVTPGRWECKCDCGNITYVDGFKLKQGHTNSCGCLSKEIVSKVAIIREEGNRYGLLTVISEAGRDKDGKVLWECKCDCGNIAIIRGTSLRLGFTRSCGCLNSKGELKVRETLDELGIIYEQQKTFNSLKSHKNALLFFDFFIPQLKTCIEYQGSQHYSNTSGWSRTIEEHQESLERDNIKRKWCKENGYFLIEIPYTDYEKINKDYIITRLKESDV